MIYEGNKTREISFPIGGIGTGSFGIAGNGRFIDWEIFNRPGKGKLLEYSHIAVKAKKPDGTTIVKILNGDETKNLTGTYMKERWHGFGYGPIPGAMASMPHFKECIFEGDFPIAKLTFKDDAFPGYVVMTVFNPFIPLDAYNSSIPAGFFNIEFVNTTDEKIEYSAVFALRNSFAPSYNEHRTEDGKHMLFMHNDESANLKWRGDMTVISDGKKTVVQPYWYRGVWFDSITMYINELLRSDTLSNRVYDTPGKDDIGCIMSTESADAGKRANIRFVFSWSMPNAFSYWDKDEGEPWKNYYATVFETSIESAKYGMDNYDELFRRTELFKNTLLDSSIDPTVIEAISATISVLKSPTVLRLEDGSFYGWEGVHELEGSCEGTCQHVWNYAYALCFLFPELEKSIRDNEFKYCTFEDGKTAFRMRLPRTKEKRTHRACVDGQMGTIIKTYREWKISGDSEWLKSNWETVKKIFAYTWSDKNPDRWDLDKDGVLEGRQHHTLDLELFGPSGWLEGMYLCALKAGAEMAGYLGDNDAQKEYTELFEKGYKWTKENLFNGEYFNHIVDVTDKNVTDGFGCSDYYWNSESGEIKYQVANGCIIDQMLGQWHSNILGLGEIYDSEQKKTALESLYKYNFKASMRDVFNTWRVFSLNDEGGVVICEYPHERPAIPISYTTETMTGFEYALAGLMISEDKEEYGLEMVKAIRDRYDGEKRNPWNEIECGSNYARAMASFALIPIYSGFKFDLPNKTIGFDPIHKDGFKSIYSVGSGWGSFAWGEKEITLTVNEGKLELEKFLIKADVKEVYCDGRKTDFKYTDGAVCFSAVKVTKDLIFKI